VADGNPAISDLRDRCPPFFLLPLLWIFCGCQDRSDAGDAGPATITLLLDQDETLMRPAVDEEEKFLVFLPMAKQREDGELEGRLARRWERSDDDQTWTYHLRTDVRWHDGVPVTAHDVVFTMKLFSDSAVAYYPPGAVTATAFDDSTVAFQYARRSAINPVTTTWWTTFLPRHLLEDLDPDSINSWDFWAHPVGNGPYRYLQHLPKTMMELEANPEYYAGAPDIQRVVLRFGPSNLLELQAGHVDVVPYVGATESIALLADLEFRVYHSINGLHGRLLLWDNRNPLFQEARVRRALTLALNRREILAAMDLPDYVPIADGPYTSRQLWARDLPDPIPYDVTEAERLLSEAGWEDVNGDGIRERGGVPFHFNLVLPGGQDWEHMAVMVREYLRRVGVEMEILAMEPAAARARWARGDIGARLWQQTLSPGALRNLLGSNSNIGYQNLRIPALIDSLETQIEPDEQARLHRAITEILREDVPVTFLMPRVVTVAAHRRVRGLESPFKVFPSRHMEELWMEWEDLPDVERSSEPGAGTPEEETR